MEEMMTTWHNLSVLFSSSLLFGLHQTLMADNGALPLLRPFLLRPSIFPSLRLWRFRNPSGSSHLLYLSSSRSLLGSVKIIPLNRRRFSYIIGAVRKEGGAEYRRTERGKRGRKRRELWEELFEDNVEDEDEDEDDFVGVGDARRTKSDLWKFLEEIVDNVWILKAFRSYGYLLPFIILSLFFSTGPKAFFISLGLAIGPSLLFLAFKKLIGWDKRRKASIANQFGIDEEEEYEVERRRYNPSQIRNNVNGRGINCEMASKFGGWDELDSLATIPEQSRSEPKRKPVRKRKRIRREESAEPLLLRLLVSMFPFLSSLTNMLKK